MQATSLQNFGPASIFERYILTFNDLTAAAGTQTFNLRALPKFSVIKGVRIKHTVLFDNNGGGCTATVAVGSLAGTTNLFSLAFDIHQAVADDTAQMTSGWKAQTTAADTLTATIASNVNVNTITQGTVYVDVELLITEDLTTAGPAGNSLSGGGLI